MQERAEVVAEVAAHVLNHLHPAPLDGPYCAAQQLMGVVYVLVPSNARPVMPPARHKGFAVLSRNEHDRGEVLHVCVGRAV